MLLPLLLNNLLGIFSENDSAKSRRKRRETVVHRREVSLVEAVKPPTDEQLLRFKAKLEGKDLDQIRAEASRQKARQAAQAAAEIELVAARKAAESARQALMAEEEEIVAITMTLTL